MVSLVSPPLNLNKLLYRACHRGTAEMDFLIGGFARAKLKSLTEPERADFAALLDMPDPALEALVWGRTLLDPKDKEQALLGSILAQIQDFHGLNP